MKTTGLIAGMKGIAWESPRGLVSIDPETRKKVRDYLPQHLESQPKIEQAR